MPSCLDWSKEHRSIGSIVVRTGRRLVEREGNLSRPYSRSHSSPSWQKYDRLAGEWKARGRQLPAETVNRVADIILAYWNFVQGYHRGESARYELGSIKQAMSILRRCYGETPAAEFGPLALQVVRDEMIKLGWSRRYINAQITRVKRCFIMGRQLRVGPLSCISGSTGGRGTKAWQDRCT